MSLAKQSQKFKEFSSLFLSHPIFCSKLLSTIWAETGQSLDSLSKGSIFQKGSLQLRKWFCGAWKEWEGELMGRKEQDSAPSKTTRMGRRCLSMATKGQWRVSRNMVWRGGCLPNTKVPVNSHEKFSWDISAENAMVEGEGKWSSRAGCRQQGEASVGRMWCEWVMLKWEGASLMEHDCPITGFGGHSVECKAGGHKKLKLKRLWRFSSEGENLASLKPTLSHSPSGINYPQSRVSARAVLVSHLPYLPHRLATGHGLRLWRRFFSKPLSFHVLCFISCQPGTEDDCLVMEKWLCEEEFTALGQTQKAINLYHKTDSQRRPAVALLCPEAFRKCKQNPWLLQATACFSESDHVLEWKQSRSDVSIPMGYKHLF